MSCKYCESKEFVNLEKSEYVDLWMHGTELGASGDSEAIKTINFCPMCGEALTPNLTPAQENAYKGSPLRSIHKPIYGVVDTPKNAVQPVFHIGDKIRLKSTGEIEKISTISHGGRFVNGVNSNYVELIKEN